MLAKENLKRVDIKCDKRDTNMNIHKIGLIERIFKPKTSIQVKSSLTAPRVDQVSLSSTAIKKFREGNGERIKQIVRDTPDIRVAKMKEVYAKIQNEDYFTNIDRDVLVDKMLNAPFGFQIKPQ